MRYAQEYATAIFDILLEKNKVEKLLNEIEMITNSIDSDKDFLKLLEHPKVAVGEKKAIIEHVFNGIDKDLKHLIFVLVDNKRLQDIGSVYLAFCDIYHQYNQILKVIALTSVELTETQMNQLETKLTKKYRKKVSITNEIDSKIIGGIRLIVNNDVMDHSISSHLTNLKSFVLKQN